MYLGIGLCFIRFLSPWALISLKCFQVQLLPFPSPSLSSAGLKGQEHTAQCPWAASENKKFYFHHFPSIWRDDLLSECVKERRKLCWLYKEQQQGQMASWKDSCVTVCPGHTRWHNVLALFNFILPSIKRREGIAGYSLIRREWAFNVQGSFQKALPSLGSFISHWDHQTGLRQLWCLDTQNTHFSCILALWSPEAFLGVCI